MPIFKSEIHWGQGGRGLSQIIQFKSVLEKKKLRSRDMIYSRAGVGAGPFTPSQCSFHYIPLQNQKPSGSKGDKFTHLKVRRVTFAVFLQNGLKMSFVLTLGHYLLCRKRGVQQANSHL